MGPIVGIVGGSDDAIAARHAGGRQLGAAVLYSAPLSVSRLNTAPLDLACGEFGPGVQSVGSSRGRALNGVGGDL